MIILDVREKDEFQAEHIPDSILCPLSQFDLQAPGILKNIKNEEIVVMCRSGNRAKMALNELKKLPVDHLTFKAYEGGLMKWKSEGKPVQTYRSSLPLMRQVQMIASSMIILAFVAAQLIHPNFVYLALFVGLGLAMAGFTGFCPMFNILQKMPWNKNTGVATCSVNKSCG